MYFKHFLSFFIILILISNVCFATDMESSPSSVNSLEESKKNESVESNLVTNSSEGSKESIAVESGSGSQFWLSIFILIFGTLTILIEYFLLRSVVKEKTEEIARTFTVTLIIIGTLLLISAGYTSAQISPALGLFGTIAGYLLGRSDQKSKTKNDTEVKSHE